MNIEQKFQHYWDVVNRSHINPQKKTELEFMIKLSSLPVVYQLSLTEKLLHKFG